MLNTSEKDELTTCVFWAFISYIVGLALIAFNQHFNIQEMSIYLVLKTLFLAIAGIGWIIFKKSETLTSTYLSWQAFVMTGGLLSDVFGVVQLLVVSTNGLVAAGIFLLLFVVAILFGFFIRVLDPNSSYRYAVNKGRFVLSSYVYNAAVSLQIKPSVNNPVLKYWGMANSTHSSIESVIKKSGLYSAFIVGAVSIFQLMDMSSALYFLLSISFVMSIGYFVSNYFVVDFYYCLKAGATSKKP